MRTLIKVGLALVSVGTVVGVGLFLTVYFYIAADLPQEIEDLEKIAKARLPLASEVYDQGGQKIGEFADERRYYKSINSFPPQVIYAFLSAEDKNFFRHSGLSVEGVFRAAWKNALRLVDAKRSRSLQGGSTITQQLARNLFLSREQTVSRKLKEVFLAWALEAKFTKQQILELYLNTVFLGNRSYGVEAASRNYFRKSVTKLNWAESAMLAALPKAPSRLAPNRNRSAAKKRQLWVIERMIQDGYLSMEQAPEVRSSMLFVHERPESHQKLAPYVVDIVRSFITKRLPHINLKEKGIRIYTTIDRNLQVQQLQRLKKLVANNRQIVSDLKSAVVAIDAKTGAIRSLIGGVDFRKSQYNNATQAQRPIGNAIIPLTVGLALDSGYSLTSPLAYSPFESQKSIRRNQLLVLDGLEQKNIYGVAKLHFQLGNGTVSSHFSQFGINFTSQDLAAAIGNVNLSLLTLSRAYTPFFNKGRLVEEYLVSRIENAQGQVIYQRQNVGSSPVLSPQTAYMINDSLNYLGSKSHRPAAPVYTASSDSRHDGWAIGFEKGLVVGLWLGSERGKTTLGKNKKIVESRISKSWERIRPFRSGKRWATPKPNDKPSTSIPPGIAFKMIPNRRGARSVPVRIDRL